MTLSAMQHQLTALSDPAQAVHLSRFFKTGKGQYGEGDLFRGIKVPQLRAIAGQFGDASLEETRALLHSPWHEDRMLALLIRVAQFQRGDAALQQAIYDDYLKNTAHINNWDLVDLSAPHIVGGWLFTRDRSALIRLARSTMLFERRIAIVATFHFICRGQHEDTFALAEMLLNDRHDLIHKAVGWMLREVGKRVSRDRLREFLLRWSNKMPRTALRYAIEHLGEPERRRWMAKP
jgi:3-methyladenine DNA glycosylase AlkD